MTIVIAWFERFELATDPHRSGVEFFVASNLDLVTRNRPETVLAKAYFLKPDPTDTTVRPCTEAKLSQGGLCTRERRVNTSLHDSDCVERKFVCLSKARNNSSNGHLVIRSRLRPPSGSAYHALNLSCCHFCRVRLPNCLSGYAQP